MTMFIIVALLATAGAGYLLRRDLLRLRPTPPGKRSRPYRVWREVATGQPGPGTRQLTGAAKAARRP